MERKYDQYGRPIKKKSFLDSLFKSKTYESNSRYEFKKNKKDSFDDKYKTQEYQDIESRVNEKLDSYEKDFKKKNPEFPEINPNLKLPDLEILSSNSIKFVYFFAVFFSMISFIVLLILIKYYDKKNLNPSQKKGLNTLRNARNLSYIVFLLNLFWPYIFSMILI